MSKNLSQRKGLRAPCHFHSTTKTDVSTVSWISEETSSLGPLTARVTPRSTSCAESGRRERTQRPAPCCVRLW